MVDLKLERIAFSILIIGIGAVFFLKGHPHQQLLIAGVAGFIAVLGFYRDRWWPDASFRSKVVWWTVFTVAEIGIFVSFGKAVWILAGLGVAIFIPILLFISLYQYWSHKHDDL